MKGLVASIIALLLIAFLAWKLCYVQKPPALPNLAGQWQERIYGLDADEMARFVVQPYSPQRVIDFNRNWGGKPPPGNSGQLVFHALPSRTPQWGMSSASGTLSSALLFANGLTPPDVDIPKELKDLPIGGDWIVRINGPMEGRMKALESILSAATGKDLLFEKRPAEREVIVVRGKWNFTPAPGGTSRRAKSVQFYTDTIDEAEGAGGGSGDFRKLIHRLEEIAERKVVDEVSERLNGDIEWSNNSSDDRATQSQAYLQQLLDNLQKQTGLEYVRMRRPIPVWFVRERGKER